MVRKQNVELFLKRFYCLISTILVKDTINLNLHYHLYYSRTFFLN